MIVEFRLMIKLKLQYFRQFWSLVQLGIIGCSWGSTGVYVWRFHESNRVKEIFNQTNGNSFINLQLAAYINELLTTLLGFCCFFGMIRFIHFFRFNHGLSLLSRTLQYAAKELASFSIMASIIFTSYFCLFHLLFASSILDCSSLTGTAQMILQMTVTRFNVNGLIKADAFLGPFCFFIFILLAVFICLNMFISIIICSFRRAREDKTEKGIILSFMFNHFLHWTGKNISLDEMILSIFIGLKKPTEGEIREQQDARMRAQYFDPIENFPDRIDQLLAAINRVC
jgi:hypothetical protein